MPTGEAALRALLATLGFATGGVQECTLVEARVYSFAEVPGYGIAGEPGYTRVGKDWEGMRSAAAAGTLEFPAGSNSGMD